MSNIINVKEEHNILSFTGDVLKVVANSTNFYLSFTLDSEWSANTVVTVVFDFDGKLEQVELDSNRKCQIPPTTSSKILFCITTSPSTTQVLSSTILSLDVEDSGDTNLDGIPVYVNTHTQLLGLVQDLLSGNVVARTAQTATLATLATRATTAATSETQVSLTGDESIAGTKNFTGTIQHNGNNVVDATQVINPNYVVNGDFKVNLRETTTYTRNGTNIYTVDRWGLFDYNGSYNYSTKTVTGLSESGPVRFNQWIEDWKSFAGKTICVSAYINGVRYHGFAEIPATLSADVIINIKETDDYVFRIYCKRSIEKVGVQFLVNYNVALVITDVKVELSDFPTKFIGRLYGEEVAICQRYYTKAKINHVGYAVDASTIRFCLPMPSAFKKAISLVISSYPSIIANGTSQVASNVAIFQTGDAGIVLTVTGSNLTPNTLYFLANGIIKIDGEIY